MPVQPSQTLRIARQLESAGMERRQAETLTTILQEVCAASAHEPERSIVREIGTDGDAHRLIARTMNEVLQERETEFWRRGFLVVLAWTATIVIITAMLTAAFVGRMLQ